MGFAWSALKEAFYCEHADRLLIVDYDLVAQAPDKVLRLVYTFIGEPYFDGHDFDNLSFDAPQFDAALGMHGLHRINRKVEFKPRDTILPPDLFKRYESHVFFGRDRASSRANVVVDWMSRRVLSWRLSNTMDADFCVDALEEALARYGSPGIFTPTKAASSPARPSSRPPPPSPGRAAGLAPI